jgi:Nucleotidyltransferase of unknown function (DUF6036)
MGNRVNKTQEAVAATSSVPEKIPSDQHALFREVLESFETSGKQYAVAGAFALQKHTGIFRSTKDLDIFMSPEAARTALKDLKKAGFQCEVCDPIWLAKVHRDGYFVDIITGMSNGVITVYQSWIDRAQPANVLGVPSRVLAAEELLASKLFVTRRERFDGADIAHIIYATRGNLDWARILELAGEHWELVLWNLLLFRYVYPAQSKLVPQTIWRDLLTRFSELVLNSAQIDGKFRGSLVDDAMFAIDVEEWGLENLLLEYQQRRSKIA